MAKVVLSYAACEDLTIAPGVFEIPIVKPAGEGKK